jgi:phosphate transport system substrate-binding protein
MQLGTRHSFLMMYKRRAIAHQRFGSGSGVTAAAEDLRFEKSGDFRISLTNAPGKQAYPIASFTWLLVPQDSNGAEKRAALLGMLRWVLTSGQKQCSALGYAPLPAAVAKSELHALDAWQ